jgi:hypothetical protein
MAVLMLGFFLPAQSNAGVNVSISVPLPPLVIPAPPALVVIPGSYVYYPPDVGTDIFFYRGYWYRPHQGHWFIARGYNGPWRTIAIERVPHVVVGVPHGFRHGPVVHERVAYRDVRKNWRGWERERHWNRHESRDNSGRVEHGRGHGNGDRH